MSSKLHALTLTVLLGGALLVGCGKSTKASPPTDAGRAGLVASPPPAALASSPWLEKNADGTYAINPGAECIEVLASSPAELALPPLGVARGVRATLSAPDTVVVAPLRLRAKLPAGRSGTPWVRVAPAVAVVRRSDREWESAYADLLEQVLPFEALLFHTSEEPWAESPEVAALSARLYAVADDVDQTMTNLRTRLSVVGARVACNNRHGAHYGQSPPIATVTTGPRGPWQSVRTTMSLWYGDYGGTAVVELLVRRVENVTLVLAFMFEGDSGEKERSALADALATAR